MSARTALAVGVLWLASLVAAAAMAREVHAPRVQPPQPNVQTQILPGAEPRILSGSDIGFRIEGWQGSTPTGTIVIRVNGQWVEPTTTKRPVFLTR